MTGREFIESVCKSVNESLDYDPLLSTYDDNTSETDLFRHVVDMIPKLKEDIINNDYLAHKLNNVKVESPDYDKYIMLIVILRLCVADFDLVIKNQFKSANKINQTKKDV